MMAQYLMALLGSQRLGGTRGGADGADFFGGLGGLGGEGGGGRWGDYVFNQEGILLYKFYLD